MSELVVKAKTIKDKGIALCHESQGYSANLRPVSLLMKSDLAPEQITKDVVKALRQVTVDMSFEEFLRRFFDMWSSDAELLTKLLGFETELENKASENPDDEWLQDYNDRVQSHLEEKMEAIAIIKAANSGEEMDLVKQYELIKLQQMFEKGVAEYGVTFDTKDTQETEVIKGAGKPAAPVQNTIENKETSVSETVDVTKSQEYLDLVKKLEEANTKISAADEIIKAQVELQKAAAITKAAGLSFVDESARADVADFILKAENASIVALLEKAQARIAELTTEVADVKKEFGEKEHGLDGKASADDLNKSAQEILHANVQKAIAKAREANTAAN